MTPIKDGRKKGRDVKKCGRMNDTAAQGRLEVTGIISRKTNVNNNSSAEFINSHAPTPPTAG